MQKPKIGQQVVWKSPVPEERFRGEVIAIDEIWSRPMRIKFDDFSPQENDPREIVGRMIEQEMYFTLQEYARHFEEEDEN